MGRAAGVTVGEQGTATPAPGPPLRVSTVTAARVLVELTHVTGTVQSVGTRSSTVQLVGGLVLPRPRRVRSAVVRTRNHRGSLATPVTVAGSRVGRGVRPVPGTPPVGR